MFYFFSAIGQSAIASIFIFESEGREQIVKMIENPLRKCGRVDCCECAVPSVGRGLSQTARAALSIRRQHVGSYQRQAGIEGKAE